MASYKKLRITSATDQYAFLRTTNQYSGDFTMTVTFTLVSQFQTQSWNVPSIEWRQATDFGSGDGYKAVFMATGCQLQRAGNEIDANWGYGFTFGVPHTVTITMTGGTMTITEGGTTIISYTDSSPIASGYYGMDALCIQADYDEISCTHFSDSFEGYSVGTTWDTAGQTFGPWTVGSPGGGTLQIISTGLRRRPIIT